MSIYIEFPERNLQMKAKISIIVLVILLIGSIAGVLYLFNKNTSLKNEMANQLADQESVISDLQSANSQLETNVSALEETIADLQQQLADLQSANDELQATIADLEQITTQEEDYFKEAEELWEQYQDQMDVNWETFREAYTTERKDNGLSQQEALDKLLDLFKKVVEQPKQQQSKEQTSSQSSTTNSNQSGSTPPPLTPEQQAIAEQMGGASYLDTSTATNGFGVSGTVDWGNITAE